MAKWQMPVFIYQFRWFSSIILYYLTNRDAVFTVIWCSHLFTGIVFLNFYYKKWANPIKTNRPGFETEKHFKDFLEAKNKQTLAKYFHRSIQKYLHQRVNNNSVTRQFKQDSIKDINIIYRISSREITIK